MGAFDFIKKIFKGEKSYTNTGVWDALTPVFSKLSDPKLNDSVASAIDAHARHGSKFRPQVYYKGAVSENKKKMNYLLRTRPNPIMNAPTFWEKVTQEYFSMNNVFIYPEWDYTQFREPLKALWLIPSDDLEIKTNNGRVYYRFKIDGTDFYTDSDNMIHISRNVGFLLDAFGKADKALARVIQLIQTNYEGLEQSIKLSQAIRYLISSPTLLTDTEKDKRAKTFADLFMTSNKSGVAYVDAGQAVTQMDTSKGKYAGGDVWQILKDSIYEHYGINKKILDASFNEDDWQSYYESSLEPLAMKIEAELTEKLLSEREREFENEIRVDANRLQTASLKTRLQVAQTIQKSPIHRPNDVLNLLYMEPIEGGDKPYMFLNYSDMEMQKGYQDNQPKLEPKKEGEDDVNEDTEPITQ